MKSTAIIETEIIAAEEKEARPENFFTRTLNTIKGKDLETKIEAFSSEITMVIEGLSDDQERLGRENRQLKSELERLESRLAAVERSGGKKSTMVAVARQLTWLAAIAGAAAVIVTALKMFV